MQETKIEWTDYSWNPIKGICPTGCWYCYARRMYKRFKWNPELSLDGELFGSCQNAFSPNILVYEMFGHIKSGRKIFVCSTIELFHPKIYKEWRDAIFKAIKDNPQHTFQILTKFPQNIDRPMPDNVWLGLTVTAIMDYPKISALGRAKAKIKFISFEPLLERDEIPLPTNLSKFVNWIIVGKLTGYGHKYDPTKEKLFKFKRFGNRFKIPIFLKDNLKEIWGEPLIQEFPNIPQLARR